MEYNSFYGGRRGASFIIVESFLSIEAMVTEFKKGGNYTTVNYDEYVIIDTENKNNIDNGKIYRRGYDYNNEMGGAEYIGQIVGPAGLGPHIALDTIANVQEKYNESQADHLDYRHASGSYSTDNSLIPGKSGNTYNDSISWEYCSVRDAEGYDTVAYVGFTIPYLVVEYTTQAVAPYNAQGNYADMTAADRIDDTTHPFYEKWRISIPNGVKGDTLKNFRVMTADNSIEPYAGQNDDIANNRKVLVYDYWKYDNQQNGERTTIYVGDYNDIDDILLDNNGTLTIQYAHDDDKEFHQKIQWIDSITLTSTGHLTVTYNTLNENTQDPNDHNIYETDLRWVSGITINSTGTVTTFYSYGNSTTTENPVVRWVTGSTYDANAGTITFNYNYGNADTYTYKYIADVTLTDAGVFTVTDNTGTVMLTKNLKWVNDIAIENDKFVIKYSQGNDKIINDVIINQIDEMAVPISGTYTYHLLVHYTATSKQGNISYNNKTGWTDLGVIKDYNGILVGTNIPKSTSSSLNTVSGCLTYLNTTYPNGITSGYAAGKIVTIGDDESDKWFFAYDYSNNEWIYLGGIDTSEVYPSCIVGDSSVATQAGQLPVGSLWFVVEGE